MHQSTLFFQLINIFFRNYEKNQTHFSHYFSEIALFIKIKLKYPIKTLKNSNNFSLLTPLLIVDDKMTFVLYRFLCGK